MKEYDVNARRSSAKQQRRIVTTILMTFATYAVFHASLGCNSQPQPASRAVPGLFAADDVWAVTSPADDRSNGLFLIRGFGSTIEYIVVSSGSPPETQFDGETEATDPTPAPPLTSVGLEPRSASISFKNGTVRMNAEFSDIQGRDCKLELAATPCTSSDPAIGTCALENLNVTMTVDGDSVVPAGVSLNLVRMESCPKSLELSEQGPGWAITSLPFLALLFSMDSAGDTEAGGSGTPSLPAFLMVQGTNDLTESAADYPSIDLAAIGVTACGGGEDMGNSLPPGSVVFDGPDLQIDLAMQQIEASDEQGNVQIVTPKGGVCSVAFQGHVTYCAIWNGTAGGETDGAPLKVIRVDGVGHRHLPGDEQTALSHVYVMLGLPDPDGSKVFIFEPATKRVIPSNWP